MNRIFLFLILLIFFSCNTNNTYKGYTNGLLEVKKVIDGDPFYVDDGSSKGKKIRLIGGDAP